MVQMAKDSEAKQATLYTDIINNAAEARRVRMRSFRRTRHRTSCSSRRTIH